MNARSIQSLYIVKKGQRKLQPAVKSVQAVCWGKSKSVNFWKPWKII